MVAPLLRFSPAGPAGHRWRHQQPVQQPLHAPPPAPRSPLHPASCDRHGPLEVHSTWRSPPLAPPRALPSKGDSPLQPAAGLQPAPALTDDVVAVLAKMRTALGLDTQTAPREVVITGRGRHLGINITYTSTWHTSGAFHEEYISNQFSLKWGYDGGADSASWEVDNSGSSKSLEADDHEGLLLTSWLKSGLWLQDAVLSRLSVRLAPPGALPPGQEASGAAATGTPLPANGSGGKTAKKPSAKAGKASATAAKVREAQNVGFFAAPAVVASCGPRSSSGSG